MTQSEAIKQIESWLLIPLSYDEVLPALRVIRNTSDFESYAARVADAEFKSTAEVIRDVDAFAGSLRNDGMSDSLVNKLEAISGKKYPDRPAQDDGFDDILGTLNEQQTPEGREDARLQEKYGAFVQGYVKGGSRAASGGGARTSDAAYGGQGGSYGGYDSPRNPRDAGPVAGANRAGSHQPASNYNACGHAHADAPLARCCPYCNGEVVECYEEKMSSSAVTWLIITALCFWPLIFIPLFCMKKEQHRYLKCRDCLRRM